MTEVIEEAVHESTVHETNGKPHGRAWRLLENPDHWCTGRYDVRNYRGMAVAWCMMQALRTVYPPKEIQGAVRVVRRAVAPFAITEFNDKMGHERVLRLLKELDV